MRRLISPASFADDTKNSLHNSVPEDDLLRKVYCLLGVPIDVVDMPSVLRNIKAAAARKLPYLISTTNINFLVASQSDQLFRESLLQSDLCLPDGTAIVWIARLIGIPIKSRIAGSDMFNALKTANCSAKPLKVFLFGGAKGVALAASQSLNAQPSGLHCVGTFYPGLGSVAEMSNHEIIDRINLSDADLLVAALGAKKGQSWLLHNNSRITIPVRTHLGAVINFQSGRVRRAPNIMQHSGLEWLWRIKEEPYLWRRYWADGKALLCLLFTRILPIYIRTWRTIFEYKRHDQNFIITPTDDNETFTLSFSGPATAQHAEKIIHALKPALATKKRIFIDFSNTTIIDARILGLLLMLRKLLKERNDFPMLVGLSVKLRKTFRLNGLDHLLFDDNSF